MESSKFSAAFMTKSPIDPKTRMLIRKYKRRKKRWEESLKDMTPENRDRRNDLYEAYAKTAIKVSNRKNVPNEIQSQISVSEHISQSENLKFENACDCMYLKVQTICVLPPGEAQIPI